MEENDMADVKNFPENSTKSQTEMEVSMPPGRVDRNIKEISDIQTAKDVKKLLTQECNFESESSEPSNDVRSPGGTASYNEGARQSEISLQQASHKASLLLRRSKSVEFVAHVLEDNIDIQTEEVYREVNSRFPNDRFIRFVLILAQLVVKSPDEKIHRKGARILRRFIIWKLQKDTVDSYRNEVLDTLRDGILREIPEHEAEGTRATEHLGDFLVEFFGHEPDLSWLDYLLDPVESDSLRERLIHYCTSRVRSKALNQSKSTTTLFKKACLPAIKHFKKSSKLNFSKYS